MEAIVMSNNEISYYENLFKEYPDVVNVNTMKEMLQKE